MAKPEHLWRLVCAHVDHLGISEREAGRRTGIDSRAWSYYLKIDRSDITPHKILKKLARLEGLSLLELERAALRDDGWTIVAE